jgi:hypothetical protein
MVRWRERIMKIINQKWYYHKDGFSHTFCVQREDKKWAVALDKFKSWIGEEISDEGPWFNTFKEVGEYIEEIIAKKRERIIRGR